VLAVVVPGGATQVADPRQLTHRYGGEPPIRTQEPTSQLEAAPVREDKHSPVHQGAREIAQGRFPLSLSGERKMPSEASRTSRHRRTPALGTPSATIPRQSAQLRRPALLPVRAARTRCLDAGRQVSASGGCLRDRRTAAGSHARPLLRAMLERRIPRDLIPRSCRRGDVARTARKLRLALASAPRLPSRAAADALGATAAATHKLQRDAVRGSARYDRKGLPIGKPRRANFLRDGVRTRTATRQVYVSHPRRNGLDGGSLRGSTPVALRRRCQSTSSLYGVRNAFRGARPKRRRPDLHQLRFRTADQALLGVLGPDGLRGAFGGPGCLCRLLWRELRLPLSPNAEVRRADPPSRT
jgi:hypothetical protein